MLVILVKVVHSSIGGCGVIDVLVVSYLLWLLVVMAVNSAMVKR